MCSRCLLLPRVLEMVMAALVLAALPAAAQARPGAADTWMSQKTAWADPDLQGI
jgi:hypothetical protein